MSTNTSSQTTRIDGIGKISGGEYENIEIDGVGSIKGDVCFQELNVNGVGTAEGTLKGNMIKISGTFTGYEDIRTKRLIIEGMATTHKKMYADFIEVEGLLTNHAEVNADVIIFDGICKVNDMFGDRIEINGCDMAFGLKKHIVPFWNFHTNKAKKIECSSLEASNLKCDSISATNISLSDNCEIGTIYCNGTLKFDRTCKINNIEGEYESVEK